MARTQEDIDLLLRRIIPYRMYCLYALHASIELRLRGLGANHGFFQIISDNVVCANGNAAGVINPWLEIGVVHGRALLEFFGLYVEKGRLRGLPKKRRDSDWHITDLDLEAVTPDRAIAAYRGNADEAEESLVSIMTYANKSIAHMTSLTEPEQYGSDKIQIAARGIHALAARYIYRALNRPHPEWGTVGI